MSIVDNKQKGIGGALFSKTQRQVLGLLFGNPEQSYYLNEIIRLAGVGMGSVQRELVKLSGVGLLTVKKVGNQKHYQANSESPIFEELRGIVLKTFGLADVLRQSLSSVAEKITIAFVYGSVAKGEDTAKSDIDVMIVTNELSYPDVMTVIASVETKLGRTVNPTLYTPVELLHKLTDENSFLCRVVEQPKIFLIGTEDDLPKP